MLRSLEDIGSGGRAQDMKALSVERVLLWPFSRLLGPEHGSNCSVDYIAPYSKPLE